MNNVTELKFKDEDGDGSSNITSVSVSPVENGFILDISTSEEEWQEVYMDRSELLMRLKEIL